MNMKTKLLQGMSFIVAFTMMCTMFVFADSAGNAAASQTNEWVSKGWARLYENQAFQADKNLTRGEMAALINSLFEFKEQKEISFTDVPVQSLYYKEVAKAFAAGYIQGKGNNIFDPAGEISNAEAYVMIARALKLDMNQQPKQMLAFKDANEVQKWAAGAVEALAQKSWINDKSKVKPSEKLIGSEAVVLLEKVSGKTESIPAAAPVAQAEEKGNGQAPLNLLGTYFVSIDNNKAVELGKIQDGNSGKDMVIMLVFDRGIVRDYWENNQKQIKLLDNKGSVIESEVFRIDGVEAEKEHIFIKPLAELKSGKTVNLVIGKDLKANNGNTLGKDETITFTVK